MWITYLRWWGHFLKEKRPYLSRAVRSMLTPVRLAFRFLKSCFNQWTVSPPDSGITRDAAGRGELGWGSSNRYRPRRPIL